MSGIMGQSIQASTRHKVVRQGESHRTAAGLPLLSKFEPACAPLWRLFDGSTLKGSVRRQAKALCTRCCRQSDCEGI